MTWLEIAAAGYASTVLVVIFWQICLIGGAPWGHLTQGGSHWRFATERADRCGCLDPNTRLYGSGHSVSRQPLPLLGTWTGLVAVAAQTLVTVLNWITPSKPERLLWAPITSLMLLLASYIVLSSYL